MGSNWTTAPLGDLLSYIGKGIVPIYTDDSVSDRAIKVLGQKCIRNQVVDYGQAKYHNNGLKPVKDTKLVQKNDILINSTGFGTAGRVAQVLEKPQHKCTTDGHVITLRTTQLDPIYLGYFIKSKQSYIEQLAEGSTGQTEINRDRLQNEIMVSFPKNINDQKQIVRFILNIDNLITLNTQLNDYLLQYSTLIFENALKYHCAEIPFSDVVVLEDSKRIPLNSRDREERKGCYPYYGATSIMGYVDDYLFDDIRVLLGEDGTVITPNGKPILQYVWGKYWVNNHAHILASSSEYSIEAIYVALARTSIAHIVTGAVQQKISQKNLNKLLLQFPDPQDIKEIDFLFAAYRSNIDESKKLEQLRNILIPKLMSGEIDVSEVDITQLNNHLSAS